MTPDNKDYIEIMPSVSDGIEVEERDTLVEIHQKILEEKDKFFQRIEKLLPPIKYQNLEEICDTFSSLLRRDAITLLPNMLQCEEDIEKKQITDLMVIKFSNGNQILNWNWKDVMQKILQDIWKYLQNLEVEGVKINVYKYIYNYFILTFEFEEEHPDVLWLVEEIREYLDRLYVEDNGKIFYIKFNAGASFHWETDNIISHSLLALEHSKNRNAQSNIIIYSKWLWEQVKEDQENKHYWMSVFKEELEKELVEGIKSDKIQIFFQGILNNHTGRIDKYESLLRFHDPSSWKMINPWLFLKYIEGTEIMDKVNVLIINRLVDTIKRNKEFIEENNIEFSINLDIKYFKEEFKYLFNYLESKLKKENILNSRIVLEILEGTDTNTSPKEEKSIITQMQLLKHRWFKIAIDDFWVWYSNFERLTKVKPDFLKIDGSLIKDIATIQDNESIVRTITNLAHGLGMKVIAEYISTPEIQRKIAKLWIDYSQGFLFSEPQKELHKLELDKKDISN